MVSDLEDDDEVKIGEMDGKESFFCNKNLFLGGSDESEDS
jgi:hypothetical protein